MPDLTGKVAQQSVMYPEQVCLQVIVRVFLARSGPRMRQSVYKARCPPWGLIWQTGPGELLGRETKSGLVAEVAQKAGSAFQQRGGSVHRATS